MVEQWIPVRFVWQAQICDFCWMRIAPAKPGRSRGDRGTRAWFEKRRQVYECLGCRSEAFRAEAARAA